MIRAVADTNVLLSAFLFGGLPRQFFDLTQSRTVQLISSPILLDELEKKLLNKFALASVDARRFRSAMEETALLVNPEIRIDHVFEDPDDDRVLECAVQGNADFIVTGDSHLLKLVSFKKIEILSVRGFMDSLPAS